MFATREENNTIVYNGTIRVISGSKFWNSFVLSENGKIVVVARENTAIVYSHSYDNEPDFSVSLEDFSINVKTCELEVIF